MNQQDNDNNNVNLAKIYRNICRNIKFKKIRVFERNLNKNYRE